MAPKGHPIPIHVSCRAKFCMELTAFQVHPQKPYSTVHWCSPFSIYATDFSLYMQQIHLSWIMTGNAAVKDLSVILLNSLALHTAHLQWENSPAVTTDLKQDFWSILGHSTNLACGLCWRRLSSVITIAIPVAMGNTIHAAVDLTPLLRSRSSVIWLVSFIKMDDPAAFGCTSAMSPDRPIPCPNLKVMIGKRNQFSIPDMLEN